MNTAPNQRVVPNDPVGRRKHIRVSTQVRAEAISECGEEVIVTVTNISQSGLQLEGNRQMLDVLLPNFNRKDRRLPVNIDVHFIITNSFRHGNEVRTKCSVVYTRRIKQGKYQLGLQFVMFYQGSEALAEFLAINGLP